MNLPTPNDGLWIKNAPMQIPTMIKILKNQKLNTHQKPHQESVLQSAYARYLVRSNQVTCMVKKVVPGQCFLSSKVLQEPTMSRIV